MKTIAILILLLLCCTIPVAAQWNADGKRAEDAPDRKTLKGFGGHLIVVKDPRAFIQEWLKAKPPKIESAESIKAGETFGVLVLFAGCKQDSGGVCNTEVDYTIYKPDGSMHAERKKQPLWKEQAPPTNNIQMGRAILAMRLTGNEPTGDYKVKAKVSDLNANISFELETRFHLK